MSLDTQQSVPKHTHLRSLLGGLILDGTWSSGSRIPSENQLSAQYGVSRTTVIRALRDMERDGLVVRKQGSGTFVRNDRSGLTAIGALIPGLMPNDIFMNVQRHLLRQAGRFGWQILHGDVLLPGEEDPAGHAPVEAANKLVEAGVQGVVLVPHHVDGKADDCNHAMLSVFERHKIPVVLLDRDICEAPARSEYDLVSLDNRRSGHEVGAHLLGRGRTELIYLGAPHLYPSTFERLDGVRKALGRAGVELPDERVLPEDSAGLQSAIDLAVGGEINAVVCNSDRSAALLMREALNAGLRIPEQLAIAGFDDQPLARLLGVPLTTIAQPVKGLAIRVAAAIRDRLTFPELPPTTIMLSGELVVREST